MGNNNLKKKGDLFQKAHDLFYEKGLANGCRQVFLDYIWNVQVMYQAGYSFSVLHTIGYGYIALQQMNLVQYYPPIYWACAVLQIESASIEQETLEEEEEEHETKEKTTNYGALATAISMLQQTGIAIQPPHVNTAQIGFIPDEATNSIVYGLKGVSKLNIETAQTIMDHRPYTSFDDFVTRLVETKQEVVGENGKAQSKSLVSKGQLISLIKAGAFDELEAGTTREALMERYLRQLFKPRTTINDKFIQEVMELGMIDPQFEQELKHHYFKVYLKSLPKYQDESVKAIKWHVISTGSPEQDEYTANYFFTHFADEMEEGRDYQYNENGQLEIALGTKRKGSFEEVSSRFLKPLNDWLKSDDCLARYNEMMYLEHKDKYAAGTKEAWEMEALSVYLDQHEVEAIDHEAHGFVSFHDLPEEAEIVGYNNYKGRQTPKFKLSRLVGCVVDKDKNKHMVSLLTPQGCITLKFHAGNFAHYDKVISVVDPTTGAKTKLEDSWFRKGTLLAVTGFRQGDNFKPRTYADSIVKHSVQRLTFDRQQRLHIQAERTQV